MTDCRLGARAALLCLLGLISIACTAEPPPPAPFARIFLVTIDTLRADHLGAYGYPRATSPFLDSLAASGVRFDRAFAHSGTTQPSHASLFTGLYPVQHGVLRNGQSLAGEFITLAELMRDAGHTTAGFTSTDAHFSWGGLTQGFEHYDELQRLEQERYRPADRTVDAAIGWLETRSRDDPFFLWLHLFDPHRPFDPPARHSAQMTPRTDQQRQRLADFLRRERFLPVRPDGPLLSRVILYDAEIAFVDEQLQRLSDWLEGSGLLEGSLWVVTADHGQGLETHGWFGHSKQIFNTQLRVPLILWSPDGRLGKGRVIDTVVEHVDMAATLAELTGVERGLAAQVEPVQGASWLPLLGWPGRYDKCCAFAQRSSYPTRRKDRNPDVPAGGLFAIQDERAKYLLFTRGADQFFDLAQDPYEQVDRILEQPELAETYRDRLTGLIDELSAGREAREVDAEAIRRLRALGYIQ